MAVFKTKFSGRIGRNAAGGAAPRDFHGIDWLHFKFNIPTTALDSADEQILMYKFPDDGDCWLFRGGNSLDTDDGVPAIGSDFSIALTDLDDATSLVWNMGIGDVDGVVDTLLITGSTVGQAAGVDYLDAIAEPLDVTGKYLIFDVTTGAGTPAAGSATVRAKVAFGKKLEEDSGVG